jgi:hypothetical protein
VDVKNVQAVPTVCNHGPLKAHPGGRDFYFEKRWGRLRLSAVRPLAGLEAGTFFS